MAKRLMYVYIITRACGSACLLLVGKFCQQLSSFDQAILDHFYVSTILQANAASGMAIHDDCKLRFLELKAKRKHRFIVFKIEENQKQVIVEKLGEPTQGYEDFTASLPADECRYAVYDFEFMTEGNVPKSRIFFIAW